MAPTKFGQLRKTEGKVFEFIKTYIAANRIPPTIREIGAAVGLYSSSTAHSHIKSLVARGLIWKDPNKVRSIRLTGATPLDACTYVDLLHRWYHYGTGNEVGGIDELLVDTVNALGLPR